MENVSAPPVCSGNRLKKKCCLGFLVLLLLCCTWSMTTLISPMTAVAVEAQQDQAAAARKLQLEGTQLQLKGKIEEALKKYEKSLSLQANPKLEDFVHRLKQHTAQVESTPSVSSPVPQETVIPETATTSTQAGTIDYTQGIWPLLQKTATTDVYFRGVTYSGNVGASAKVEYEAVNKIAAGVPPLLTDIEIIPGDDGKTIAQLTINQKDDTNPGMARIKMVFTGGLDLYSVDIDAENPSPRQQAYYTAGKNIHGTVSTAQQDADGTLTWSTESEIQDTGSVTVWFRVGEPDSPPVVAPPASSSSVQPISSPSEPVPLAKETDLKLLPAEVGDAEGALKTIQGWWNTYGVKKPASIAMVDLNGDKTNEVIVHVTDFYCSKKGDGICPMTVLRLKGDENKTWDSMTPSSLKAKKVRLLPTATKGYHDLLFDDKLYTYDGQSYREGQKQGGAASSKEAVKATNLVRIEHFGLSMEIGNDWKKWGQNETFKDYQSGYSNHEGYLPGAKQKVYLSILIDSKSIAKLIAEDPGLKSIKKTPIGSGTINGHPIDISYFDLAGDNWKAGEVSLRFKEDMYFTDPEDNHSFPKHVYINLSGDLFRNLTDAEKDNVLKNYVAPFLKTIKVEENNSFKTTTTEKTSIMIH